MDENNPYPTNRTTAETKQSPAIKTILVCIDLNIIVRFFFVVICYETILDENRFKFNVHVTILLFVEFFFQKSFST
ncbi:MAG TPA: hypothetical protein CFH80_06740 [Sulfurospirillum cavolei]|uniref:Uncharacterized protein n=1 Tax=Sulfurospirillum cavolei TaxID=366522 RepID=A0A2D3WCS5_9BACT|nr:MAG TPA: hypothetical protein CFH80_06740 [Sulfurospirillum cavolei]